jgi:arginyl-tRNA synthetase
MLFESLLRALSAATIKELYNLEVDPLNLVVNTTRKEFEGDLTLVVFGVSKMAGKSPDVIGNEIGTRLMEKEPLIESFNFLKGFLNICFHRLAWMEAFLAKPEYYFPLQDPKPVLVEYSSPNTNKPLHLGHIRNNLLGYSIATILKAAGSNVKKVNLVNDRGIHICKSMLAWQKSGLNETPESTGMKGDHLVGKYYVEFDRLYKADVEKLKAQGLTEEEAKKQAPVMKEAQAMLRKWEENDPDTLALWKKMNSWVYAGFETTYKMLGVDFDQMYYESETYVEGKKIVQEGLDKGVFFRKPDGSVWVDLTADGLDEKLLLRGDGTSVYITQDIGTARLRYEHTGFRQLLYVVGNEQDYHFKVLKLVLKKLGYEWWSLLHHLSYAMVDLPSGKMKSREGTVVDADDLMQEMLIEAERITTELGKTGELEGEKAEELFHLVGMGALKYFILKVDPEKKILFNPAESIDFNGHTGPFIQYTHARIRSVIRKGVSQQLLPQAIVSDYVPEAKEHELMKFLLSYKDYLQESAQRYSPAVMANYAFELAKLYNQFYQAFPIVDADYPERSAFRLLLSERCADALKESMLLIGINVPDKM